MKYYNPGLRWYPYVGRIVMDVDGVPKHVLQRVFCVLLSSQRPSSIVVP
jgi:hypothetical protein